MIQIEPRPKPNFQLKLDRLLLAAGLLFFFSVPMSKFIVNGVSRGDYFFHIELAKQMGDTGKILAPHFLYHVLICLFSGFGRFCDYQIAGHYLVPLFSYILIGLCLHRVLWSTVSAGAATPNLGWRVTVVATTFALMLVEPFDLTTYPNLYLGYIGINIYHNPTVILAKAFSFIVFFQLIQYFSNPHKAPGGLRIDATTLAIAGVLSTLSKPNFILCLIPAIVLFLAFRFARHGRFLGEWILGCAVIIPNLLVLCWQYYFTYKENSTLSGGDGAVIFAPFAVMSIYSKSVLSGFLLSILFPLGVYFLYLNRCRRSLRFNFAWLLFGVSMFYTYFLAESGSRMAHGNFWWGGQICLFILFVCSVLEVCAEVRHVQNKETRGPWFYLQTVAGLLLFSLHLASGIYLYMHPRLYW